jgi:hypothetical protein
LAETSILALLDSDDFPVTQRGQSVTQGITAAVNTAEPKFRGISLVPGLLWRVVTENSDILSICHSITVILIREHNDVSHISTHFSI